MDTKRRSEDRAADLSRHHYAHTWIYKTYTVAETNSLACRYITEKDLVEKESIGIILVQRFHAVLHKFMKLLVTGIPDLKNKSQKKFLGLFISKSGYATDSDFRNTAMQLTITFRNETPDDIYNHMVSLFMKLLSEYNPTLNVGFVYYINNFFKFHLKKFVVSRYYDALDYQFIDSEDIATYIRFEQPSESGSTQRLATDVLVQEATHEEAVDKNIDVMSSKEFGSLKELTNFEKYVLYLTVVKGLTRVQVAKIFKISNNHVSGMMKRIRRLCGRDVERKVSQ